MAFERSQLSLLSYANGFGIWHYVSAVDDLATISAPDYINGVGPSLMRPGHTILVDAADVRAWRTVLANVGGAVELSIAAAESYLRLQDEVTGDYTFVQTDSGRDKVFTGGGAAATWTLPALHNGSNALAHNIGSSPIFFVGSGVTLIGPGTLTVNQTAAIWWLPGNVVKVT